MRNLGVQEIIKKKKHAHISFNQSSNCQGYMSQIWFYVKKIFQLMSSCLTCIAVAISYCNNMQENFLFESLYLQKAHCKSVGMSWYYPIKLFLLYLVTDSAVSNCAKNGAQIRLPLLTNESCYLIIPTSNSWLSSQHYSFSIYSFSAHVNTLR